MLMFRFWGSEARGSEKSLDSSVCEPISPTDSAATSPRELGLKLARPTKRCSSEITGDPTVHSASEKRARLTPNSLEDGSPLPVNGTDVVERARDEIRHQFGVEVLLKHDELRLINQELGKCQAALEQLRRCHLIPYPVSRPTPEQMLDIASGKGKTVQAHPDDPIPRWAAPFGVTDGPYARHYAKWLIPDPSFDGQEPEWHFTSEGARARASMAEGRATRNSFAEPSHVTKGRGHRGHSSHKLQSLPSSYPPPKDKAGPCVLKRSDGQTVKLVCIDCHRENFSSTQGFINHCRIAHKRDFKSHEEAAVHCGQPVDGAAEGVKHSPVEEKMPTVTQACVATVHPLAQPDMSETYRTLRARLDDTLKLYNTGKMPSVIAMPTKGANRKKQPLSGGSEGLFETAATEVPHLSRLVRKRKFEGNLHELVADAKTRVSFDDITPGEESDETDSSSSVPAAPKDRHAPHAPVVMRIPAKSTQSAASPVSGSRPASSKSQAHLLAIASRPSSTSGETPRTDTTPMLSDDDMDMADANLSPNTMISNNAPSLVSDDGEYDDSDEGSSISGGSDGIDAESMSDVAEITLDDEHDARALRRASAAATNTVRLRKDESKQVGFVSAVKRRSRGRKNRNV